MNALAEAQNVAVARLDKLGPPSVRQEDWRYVQLADYKEFDPAGSQTADQAIAAAREQLGDLLDDAVVLVDGCPQGELPTGLSTTITPALISAWHERLGHADLGEAHSLAHWTGGLQLQATGTMAKPLTIVSIVSGGEFGWRLGIEANKGALADLQLIHCHLAHARSSCAIDVLLEQDAVVRIDEVELGSVGQVHVAKHLQLGKNANLHWSLATAGGQLSRHLAYAHINGSGAMADLAGTAKLTGHDQHHQLIRVYHHVGEANSRQAFRTVADDHSTASFDGIIHVDEGADDTDAFQNSANMQLGPKARIATRPQLDIYADEVVASHGATVGQPDADEIRYLATRGIDGALARELIIGGFLMEGAETLHLPTTGALAQRVLGL